MFDGNAREAMEFYKKALGGELHLRTFGESGQGAPEMADRVMHAKLASGSWALMGSEIMGGGPMAAGNNFSVALTCEVPRSRTGSTRHWGRAARRPCPCRTPSGVRALGC